MSTSVFAGRSIRAHAASAGGSARDVSGRALLVEDEPDFISLLDFHLRDLGFSCSEAPNAEEAQTLLTQTGFDVVIIDMLLPVMSGAELIGWLRAQPDGWRPAVVAVSILEQPPQVHELADVVLAKPFRRTKLISAIQQATAVRDSRIGM